MESETLKTDSLPLQDLKDKYFITVCVKANTLPIKLVFFASQAEIDLHTSEKSLRQLKRTLTDVMVAKSMQSSPGLLFATHIQQANTTGANTLFTVYGRIKAELVSFDNSRQALIGTKIALSNWIGWEPGKYRPLKVGCNIGRQGANSPRTLGCFVTIGNNIYISSN